MNAIRSEVYAETDTPLGNGCFTADGRLVVSHHPMYATDVRVSIFRPDGGLDPFPNAAWNTPRQDDEDWLDAVLGLRDDPEGRVWLLDMGTRSKITPKFVVWDTRADQLERIIRLPPETLDRHSEPNDFAIDRPRNKIYIADEGAGDGGDGSTAALIVVDLATGDAVRRLQGRLGIASEDRHLHVEGRTITRQPPGGDGREPLRVGADGIALDPEGVWLYISPLNGHGLWRLRVEDLLNPALDDDALAERLQRISDKPNSGGMCFDRAGRLHLTEIETNSIGRFSPETGVYDRVLERGDMFWPDGIMAGPDGALYVVVTQLPRSPVLSETGEDRAERPFKVIRFEP